MRIAFVGKGGSGKTTLSALFIQHLRMRESAKPVLAVDADLNIHLPGLLGLSETIPETLHISHPDSVNKIKSYLRGENKRIRNAAHFRKTTPPAEGSNFIMLGDRGNPVIAEFAVKGHGVDLLVVGTYDTDDIGASCYHNNLAILENILSHLVDDNGVIVADMVAGVDAFANTLHAQFDILVLAVEPTRRGVEVFEQYRSLAAEAGVHESLFVVGNKIRSVVDMDFIKEHIPSEKILGFLKESEYLRRKDQEGGLLDVDLLEDENRKLLTHIENKLFSVTPDRRARLRKLFELHRRYVAQGFITEQYGDLTGQIDESFDFDEYAERRKNNRISP